MVHFHVDMLPSIGQIEAGKTPSKVEEIDGYNLTTYDDDIWNQIKMKCEMFVRNLINRQYIQPLRDMLLLCAGGLCVHLYQKKWK